MVLIQRIEITYITYFHTFRSIESINNSQHVNKIVNRTLTKLLMPVLRV
jgi:hypothetical protein